MQRSMLKSKISYATVTETELYYQGSITIDRKIIDAAGLLIHEQVTILNLNNGERFDTYVIEGKPDSGMICLNGPAARLGCRGDKIIIVSYGLYSEAELAQFKTKFVQLDERNKITNTHLA